MPRLPASETPSSREHGLASGGASIHASLRLLLIAAALGSGVFLAWQTAGALLMIFGGLLLAALLDAATRGLLHILPVGRGACFAIVCTIEVARRPSRHDRSSRPVDCVRADRFGYAWCTASRFNGRRLKLHPLFGRLCRGRPNRHRGLLSGEHDGRLGDRDLSFYPDHRRIRTHAAHSATHGPYPTRPRAWYANVDGNVVWRHRDRPGCAASGGAARGNHALFGA